MLGLARHQWWTAQPGYPADVSLISGPRAQHMVLILFLLSTAASLMDWTMLFTAAALLLTLSLQKSAFSCYQGMQTQVCAEDTVEDAAVSALTSCAETVAAQDLLFETLIAQLGHGKQLGDQSVNRLVEDFNLLFISVRESMQLAQSAAKRFEPGSDSFAAKSEVSLAQVLQMLQQALARKTLLLESNQQVAQAASALKHQTEIIQRISKEITLLSLNASIEAARAGEAGRGFSVVAERVRELSDTTSQAASDIISRMQTLMQAIAGSSGQLQSSGELDEQLMADANQRIGSVLSGLTDMTNELCGTIGQLEKTQIQVQDKLQDAITDFQFQDRVSQRLSHIVAVLQQLQQLHLSDTALTLSDVEQIAVNLYQSYTMQDERELHKAARPAESLQHSQQDITFF